MNAPDRPRDHCGVFGVFGHPDSVVLTYYGLYALQHRGQESAGIVSATEDGARMKSHIGMGLVSQIFDETALKSIPGNRAIGHVRYSTTGSSLLKNAQPLLVDCSRGQIAIAHNGNLVNANALRNQLELKGSIFQTTVDSEIILHLLSQPSPEASTSSDANLMKVMSQIQGAFSLVIMGDHEIIGVRDPHGFRPLSIGKIDGAYVLSSETCAFDLIHAEFIRDVQPGEIVIINKDGLRSVMMEKPNRSAMCVFEYVYFARPDSTLEGQSVAHVRTEMGRRLAREDDIEADLVIPVPDSGNYCALGYSEESKIPLSFAFVRNHYIGRTFLQPSQLIRDFNVRVKLNLIEEEVRGKRVVVVDDSIVRGTTAKARVNNLREAGAKEVHIRVSCPPHKFPCHYGIDFPTRKELIANEYTMEEIKKYLGADSIRYLSLENMIASTNHPASKFCTACYTGDYPVQVEDNLNKFVMESRVLRRAPLGSSFVEDRQQKLL